jgi:hypothetical protein
MQNVLVLEGTPKPLTRLEASDVVQSLPASAYEFAGGGVAETAIATCEVNALRVGFFDEDLGQGAEGKGLILQPGDVLRLNSAAQIRQLRFMNFEAETTGVLQFIPFV